MNAHLRMTPKQGHNGKSNAHRTHKGISRGMHKVLCVIKLMPCVCVCVRWFFVCRANIKPFYSTPPSTNDETHAQRMNIIQTYHRRKFYFRPSDRTSTLTNTKVYRSVQKWCVLCIRNQHH